MTQHADTAEHEKWDVFLCHRQVDGRETAEWLVANVQDHLVPTGGSPEPRVNFYFDVETPAVPNWRDVNRSALINARAMILVCSPGAAHVRGPQDEVQAEIRWWVRHRKTAPILIDCTGKGEAWVPEVVHREWPDAQLVEVLAAQWAGEDEELLERNTKRAIGRIVEGIRLSALSVRDEQLEARVRSARRLRFALAAAGVAFVLAAGLFAWAWVSKRAADRARDTANRALVEVLRLSDGKQVRDLVEEERRLWPVHPDQESALAEWIRAARDLEERRPVHAAALARLRAKGEDGGERTPQDAWQVEILEGILAGLDRIHRGGGLLAEVAERLEASARLAERSTGRHADAWGAAIARIAASERYDGLALTPQLGLVPLGPDPDSGLEEFAHVGSGSLPTRDHGTGRLAYEEGAAIVLVLVPAGTFWMGAQKADPGGRNHDPEAHPQSSPVHQVTLSQPFFLAKHECTQAQWKTLSGGEIPSFYMIGKKIDREITGRHPVEHVSWRDCVGADGLLRRHRLDLPTEAQWEYACRGGNPDGASGAWCFGSGLADLGAYANIADAYCKENGGPPHGNYTVEVSDGHVVHAPVESFRANAFGLHDVHGNVWEICLDEHAPYRAVPVTDPIGDNPDADSCVSRGGGWYNTAEMTRSGYRFEVPADKTSEHAGIRPACPIVR